jgi:AbrB family transcriptional regulator (stage V sporulation protein T)
VKSTGVLRRIDDLGRIVIPKEIRKNLKIRDGESLEIFINGDAVVLKKYSFMSDLYNVAQSCSDAIYDVINKNIIITDRDKVIGASGPLKKTYIGKDISHFVESAIDKRGNLVENNKNSIEIIDGVIEEFKYVISSVIVNGDAVGAVIILSDKSINEFEEKSASFISKFLSKHLE